MQRENPCKAVCAKYVPISLVDTEAIVGGGFPHEAQRKKKYVESVPRVESNEQNAVVLTATLRLDSKIADREELQTLLNRKMTVAAMNSSYDNAKGEYCSKIYTTRKFEHRQLTKLSSQDR